MKTPDDIKKGLKACVAGECHSKRHECPYRDEAECTMALSEDALSLIRQLESKLAEYEKPLVPMTLEEVKAHVKGTEAAPLWLEDIEEPLNTGWTYSHIIGDWMAKNGSVDYGETWRCWSRRPTDEEREAAKWDE